MTDEELKALKLQVENMQAQLAVSPNRLTQGIVSSPANAANAVEVVQPGVAVFTVPLWVKLVVAGLIPIAGALATQLSGVAALVAGCVGLALTGIAGYLGMTVGTPQLKR